MVDLSEKHFLEIFEEMVKTRWAYTCTCQPEMTKSDWYQRGTIG